MKAAAIVLEALAVLLGAAAAVAVFGCASTGSSATARPLVNVEPAHNYVEAHTGERVYRSQVRAQTADARLLWTSWSAEPEGAERASVEWAARNGLHGAVACGAAGKVCGR